MRINGNLELHPSGAAAILNAFIERVNNADEAAITVTSTVDHMGRLIYNSDTQELKVWNGAKFVDFLSSDNDGTSITIDSLIQSLGLVTADGLFDGVKLEGFVSPVQGATNLLELLMGLDGAISQNAVALEMTSLSSLADVNVTAAMDTSVLRYKASTTQWEPAILMLGDIADVPVAAAELSALQGISETIQPVLDALKTSTTETEAVITDHENKLDALATTVDVLSSTGTHQVDIASPATGFASVQQIGAIFQYNGDMTLPYPGTGVIGTVDASVAPLSVRTFAIPAISTDWTGVAHVTFNVSGEIEVSAISSNTLTDQDIISLNLSGIMYARV